MEDYFWGNITKVLYKNSKQSSNCDLLLKEVALNTLIQSKLKIES